MVWHLVLLSPRRDLQADDRRRFVEAFERAVRDIPTVRDVRVGRRITHGAAYEGLGPLSLEYVVALGFDDLAGLQTYLAHPAHQELGNRFYQSISAALVHDFEIGGMEILDRLL